LRPNDTNAQAELFENSDASVPAPSLKFFRGANGVELPYWEEDGKIVRVALADKLVLEVTEQKGGHIYANDPGRWGRIERKNKISFLSAAAQIRRAIEINDSIQSKLKEQREILSTASEIHSLPPARAIGGRKRHATAEFSQREFGPVITSFEGIEEYPLGTPSWVARRPELEWSRKAIYGQLRRWFAVLRTGCTVIKSNERLGEQIGLGREAVGAGLRELEDLRLIHIEGPAKGHRCAFLHVHPWMKNPEAIPTWVKLPQVEQAACGDSRQQLAATSPISCGKFTHKETSKDDYQNKKRVLAPDCERALLDQLAEILGAVEMRKNGGMWRLRIRRGPNERCALRDTVEDYKVRTPAQRGAITDLPAWFTDRYQRNLVKR
jgi:hypothetical protein